MGMSKGWNGEMCFFSDYLQVAKRQLYIFRCFRPSVFLNETFIA